MRACPQFDETPLHIVASVCDDRSDKVGGFLAVAKLLVGEGGNPALYDNVRCERWLQLAAPLSDICLAARVGKRLCCSRPRAAA